MWAERQGRVRDSYVFFNRKPLSHRDNGAGLSFSCHVTSYGA